MKLFVSSIFILFFSVTSIFAKCPVVNISVSGEIVSLGNVSVENSLVTIFFDNNSKGFCAKVANDGSYNISSLYDTYSGSFLFGGDKCDHSPSLITVVVVSDGHWPTRLEDHISDHVPNQKVTLEPRPIKTITKN